MRSLLPSAFRHWQNDLLSPRRGTAFFSLTLPPPSYFHGWVNSCLHLSPPLSFSLSLDFFLPWTIYLTRFGISLTWWIQILGPKLMSDRVEARQFHKVRKTRQGMESQVPPSCRDPLKPKSCTPLNAFQHLSSAVPHVEEAVRYLPSTRSHRGRNIRSKRVPGSRRRLRGVISEFGHRFPIHNT